jgi:hypothetical protein
MSKANTFFAIYQDLYPNLAAQHLKLLEEIISETYSKKTSNFVHDRYENGNQDNVRGFSEEYHKCRDKKQREEEASAKLRAIHNRSLMKENDDRAFLRDRLPTSIYRYEGRKHITQGGLLPQFPITEDSAIEWLEWERNNRGGMDMTMDAFVRTNFFPNQREPMNITWNQRLNHNIHDSPSDNRTPIGINIYWRNHHQKKHSIP